MKRICFAVVLALTMLLSCAPAFAATGIYDNAGLFYETELTALRQELDSLAELTGWDAAVVTEDDTGGKTSTVYADDLYAELGYGDNGVIYLIDMDNREIYISTTGTASQYLTGTRLETIFDTAADYASQGSFYKAVSSEITMSMDYFQAGSPVDKEMAAIQIAVIITGAVIGIASAAVWALSVYKQYSFKEIGEIYEYSSKSKMNLSVSSDKLVNSFITTRIRPRQRRTPPRSGGRSGSMHRASSGRMHGGGGRRF